MVPLQDQINDVTQEGHFPLRETQLEELLLAEYGLIVEYIPKNLDAHIMHTQLKRLLQHSD